MKALTLGDRFFLPVLSRNAIATRQENIGTRPQDEPIERPLWVYILDPASVGLQNSGVILKVPYEKLLPGPVGARFAVDPKVATEMLKKLDWSERRAKDAQKPLDLDQPGLAMSAGIRPTTGDPQFAAQMGYAVCQNVYRTFSLALGRDVTFGPWCKRAFDRGGRTHLLIQPYAFEEDNAFYDSNTGTLQFGFFINQLAESNLISKGNVQQYSLSHDIICHELSHALLDGMRSHFMDDTNIDVPAFHEGFSDLIALLHHFTHVQLVEQAIEETGGVGIHALLQLGRQLGESDARTGGSAMRSAMDAFIEEARPDGVKDEAWHEFDELDEVSENRIKLTLKNVEGKECHDRGAVLVAAVMEAMLVVFRKRALPYRRLARAISPSDSSSLPKELVVLLTREVIKLANHFLCMLIRAIDYCPPVDIRFGEFLRALITADRELVPIDEYDYRGALIRAFRRRGVTFANVLDLSEDSLCWAPPWTPLSQLHDLAFSKLKLDDSGKAAVDMAEMLRWTDVIEKYFSENESRYAVFGLMPVNKPYGSITIESINLTSRLTRRKEVVRGVVIELTQIRFGLKSKFVGGATVILDESGTVRYVVRKRVDSVKQRSFQMEYRKGRDSAIVDLKKLHGRFNKTQVMT